MAYVTIPKDLSRIQSKVLFGLTKRQVICFGAAALVGVPLFFLAKSSLGTTTAALCMILVMLPFFLFAMYLTLSGDEWEHERPREKQTEKKPSIKERLEQSRKECAGQSKVQPHREKPAPER